MRTYVSLYWPANGDTTKYTAEWINAVMRAFLPNAVVQIERLEFVEEQ